MTAKKSGSTLLASASLLVAAAMLLTGCSTESPVAPTNVPTTETVQPRVLSRGGSLASPAFATPVPLYTEAVISGSQSGRLQLCDVILDIPAGALNNDTTYSISIPDINVFYNEFGTNGLVFNKPVTVTMSYRDADLTGINESSIRIGWWDQEHAKWVDMTCTLDRVNQVVIGQLSHFSAYALVSD